MDRRSLLLWTILWTAGAGGCCGLSLPDWSHPGSAAYQQQKAERFDPYPENEPGPQVVGARPREYQKPSPEPSRARQLPLRPGGP